MGLSYYFEIETPQPPFTIIEMLMDNISRKIEITTMNDAWHSKQNEFNLYGYNVELENSFSKLLGLSPTIRICFHCSSYQRERAYVPIIKSVTKFMLNSTNNAVLLLEGEEVVLMRKDGRYIHNRQFDVWAQWTGLIEEDPELDDLLKTNFHDEFIPVL